MIKVIDVVYHCHNEYDQPKQVIAKHAPSLGFTDYLKNRLDISFVKHANYEGIEKINNIEYAFFKSNNSFWHIPFKTHRYIKKQDPDIVIVEGLVFPLQLMMLKLKLGKKCRIIAQYHNEKPFTGLKKYFQKMADYSINTYLFTSRDEAKDWVNKKIIKDPLKCREILEASTYFTKKDKAQSQARVGMRGKYNFLWVGRLNKNKDPFTVLRSFERYASLNPEVRLYMIYQENQLADEVKRMIEQNIVLKKSVTLVGKVIHDELVYWYSAANFYISGSHRDASSYALLEAMACGCIPIVTKIPSFKKITCNGEFGFLFPAGDEKSLSEILNGIEQVNIEEKANAVEKYFRKNLGFKNIADDMVEIFEKLIPVKC